jgi:hypothetical protein
MTQDTALVLDGPRMNGAMLDFSNDRMPLLELLHVITRWPMNWAMRRRR